MKFAIAKLIIWPRDPSKPARVVTFSESGINLITGSSRSGKSAIIKIIDYCLGSRTCSIPKLGPIRRSSAWYGISVCCTEGYKLLARRDPDAQDSTDDYMLVESIGPTVPDFPVKNTNRASVKAMLARLAQLPQSTTDIFETGSGYKGRVSFSDMTSFMFQPQSIVANDRVLFYEAEDEDHARKLREVFPLVLGAVDADTLVKQHRLAEVRRMIERRRREYEALNNSVQDFAGAVRGRYLGAIDLGLIQTDIGSIDQADTRVLLTRLQELAMDWVAGGRPTREGVSFSVAPRLADLRLRESEAAQQLVSLRLRQVQLRELSQARQISEGVLARERDRLTPTSWLSVEIAKVADCPFCGSENGAGTLELERLKERAAAVESQWHGIATVPPMLDAEEMEIRRAQAETEEVLRQVRAERAQLEQLTDASRKADEERAVFVGKLLEFLSVQRALTGDASLAQEIRDLEVEEQELRVQVDVDAIAQRKEDALLLISKFAQHYGGIVELEDNDAIIKLDTRELNVRVLNNRGESAWLHQIGSGANHLGYHVATMLALHEFFVTKPIPYVPSLLILDQPSQTQFPDDVDEEAEREELRAVQRAFEAFDDAVERTNGVLQVIVSEHAGKTVYAGIRRLTVIERWRRGRKLIPWHWDGEALQGLSGQRAEWAAEDLIDMALRPALDVAFGPSQASVVSEIHIESATFTEAGIEFQLLAGIRHPPKLSDAGGTAPSSEATTTYRVKGSIRQDLSVSILSSDALERR